MTRSIPEGVAVYTDKPTGHIVACLLGTILISALLSPGAADAQFPALKRESRLSGTAALEYVEYGAKGGGADIEASTLGQHYSLLYETSGTASREYLGKYSLALGYEWYSIDTSIRSGDTKGDIAARSGRPLYNASIYLNPQTMPITISAYSQDTGRSRVGTDEDSALNNGDRLISPGIATSITPPGTHVSSGFSLLIGAKPGASAAANQYLVQLPGIYIDFDDTYSKDGSGITRIETHMQKWSVSGRFADNWLHYRTLDYTDTNGLGNYQQTEFQFGLVDKNNRRQWTRLTNWIKVSADGRVTKRNGASSDQNFEEYDLNLFGIATRRTWTASTFFNYNRDLTQGTMVTVRRLPVQLKGIWNADTDWSLSFRQEENRTATMTADRSAIAGATTTRNTYAALQVQSFKRRDFMLTSGLSVEHMAADGGAQTIGAEASAETTSTSRFSRNLTLGARLAARAFQDVQTGQTSYSSDLRLDSRYQHSRTFSFVFSDVASYGRQDAAATATTNIGQAASTAATIGGLTTTTAVVGASYLRNAASVGVTWTPVARFKTSFTAVNSITTATGQPNQMASTFNHSLDYSLPTVTVRTNASYAIQDNGDGNTTRMVQGTGLFAYKPQRSMETSARFTIARTTSGTTSYRNYDLVQSARYSLFNRTGLNKKLVELYEEFTYTRGEANGDKDTLLAAVVYYPFSRLALTGRTSYDFLSATTMYGAGVTANFKLLDATADYTYAKRDSDKRVEHRLAAKVQRNF